jgi:hypothetical protein
MRVRECIRAAFRTQQNHSRDVPFIIAFSLSLCLSLLFARYYFSLRRIIAVREPTETGYR